MSCLLDTHALLWLVGHGPRPSVEVSKAVTSTDNTLVVSAVSAFEIATKVRLGKLEEGRALQENWNRSIEALGAETLDLTAEHALLAGELAWGHKDPFDRLLAAQAASAGLSLVTADRAFDTAPGLVLLRW